MFANFMRNGHCATEVSREKRVSMLCIRATAIRKRDRP